MRFPKALGWAWLVLFALPVLSLPAIAIADDDDEEEQEVCEREEGESHEDWEDKEHEKAFTAGFACATICIILGLILCAIWILICVLVYRDCVARDMESPVLWLILLQLTGLIGLIIYLIVRSPKEE